MRLKGAVITPLMRGNLAAGTDYPAQGITPSGPKAVPVAEALGGERELQSMNRGMEAWMKEVLPICCFCEKVRDDAGPETGEGLWQDMQIHMVSRGLRPLNTIFVYGCCPDCLTDDPRAIAFRARSSHSDSSIRENRPSLR